jgi:endonuclease/exonuclease/phosphatase family metal-dependent hydrolase
MQKNLLTILMIFVIIFSGVSFKETTATSIEKNLLENDLSILTQNCYIPRFWDKWIRMDILSEKISNYDIIFLQEILFSSELNPIDKEFTRTYEDARVGPKGGLVILTKKEPKEIQFYKYKEQGSIFSLQFFDRLLEKGVLVAQFDDLILINTHLISPYNSDINGTDYKHNIKQFYELFDIVEEEIKKNKTIILGGDFNFNEDSVQYKEITTLLEDKTSDLSGRIDHGSMQKQIDFIFASEGVVENKAVNIPEIFLSDHPGISTKINFILKALN